MLGACLPPCVYEVVVLWELDNGGGVCRFAGYGTPTGGSSPLVGNSAFRVP